MHDPLNAIRRLYGEPGDSAPPEEMTPEEQAEFKAMADLKAALDRLPPRSPDASVVDAVVAAAGAAALGPVRAVYGEEVELGHESSLAEARALSEVKAGLDALPPQRPDASLVDAVVAAAGDAARAAALAPIRAVYDEDAEPLTTEAAEAEAAALGAMKAALDALPPRRPDPSVLDAVVAAAAQPSARPATVAAAAGRAADRPARGAETRRRVAAVLGAAFAVVLVFAGGLWMNQDTPSSQLVAEAEQAEAQAPSAEEQIAEASPSASIEAEATAPLADEGLVAASPPPIQAQAAPPAARSAPSAASEVEETLELLEADAVVAPQAFATRAAGATADDVRLTNAEALALDADADDELRLLYLRLREMQDAQAGLGWDTPPVALGAAPDSTPTLPASGWMQVRVQR